MKSQDSFQAIECFEKFMVLLDDICLDDTSLVLLL